MNVNFANLTLFSHVKRPNAQDKEFVFFAKNHLCCQTKIDKQNHLIMSSTEDKQQCYEIVKSQPIADGDRRHFLPTSDECDNATNSGDEEKWTEGFYFIQAADTQFGMIDNYLKKLENPKWDEEIRLSQLLVDKCNKLQPKPKFMVVCGDLTDAWPGTQMRKQQVFDFKRIFSQLDQSIPLVCVCGNHDIGNEPTPDSLSEYKQDFGDDYYYFTKMGVLFIVLNSQFYQHRANLEEYAKGQDIWLDQILTGCKDFKYSIVFEHIPWFLQQPDEEDEYFNIDRPIRLFWLNKFKEAGVNKIMCGHYHRNAGGWYENIELVVTSAVGAQLGRDKSGIRIVRMLESGIEHEYYALDDIPDEVDVSQKQ